MNELGELQRLLSEVADLLKSGSAVNKRLAVGKLREMAATASTLGFTLDLRR